MNQDFSRNAACRSNFMITRGELGTLLCYLRAAERLGRNSSARPQQAMVSAISLRSREQFLCYKEPCLATFSTIRKHQLLFHPKLSFKMSSRNGFSLPAAKCHQPVAYDPCQALNPASQLSQGHTQSRAISGGIYSNLRSRVSLWGSARVCHLCWEHLCGDLPYSVASAHLSSVPTCWEFLWSPLRQLHHRYSHQLEKPTLLRLFTGSADPAFNLHWYQEMLKCHGLLWRTRWPPGNPSLSSGVQVNTEQRYTPHHCPHPQRYERQKFRGGYF